MAQKVETGCRDCKKCTNSAYANFGRNLGRRSALVVTAGLSEAVMLGTKNCGICGHKLSLHQSADSVLVRAAGTSAPAGWYDDGSGRQRWWDGHAWGGFKEAVEEPGTLPAAPSVMQVEPLTVQDSHAKLLQLVELHAQGTLTDDEFREAKRQVLGL